MKLSLMYEFYVTVFSNIIIDLALNLGYLKEWTKRAHEIRQIPSLQKRCLKYSINLNKDFKICRQEFGPKLPLTPF